MAANLEFGIRITADGRVLVTEAGRAETALKRVGAAADGVNQQVDGASRALANMGHAGAAIYGLAQAFQGLRAAVRVLDEFSAINSRLALVTSSASQLAAVQRDLFGIAQQSRTSYTSLSEVYARLATATRDLGVGQDRLLGVTRSISQAMTIGGGSAESMRAALVQLGQGLASGTLRGEELNSILEQAPRLAQAIAEGMGTSVGELRKLGEAGQLTARQIIGALERAGPGLENEFRRITPTIGQAFQTLTDAAGLFLSEFDKGSGTSKALATAIADLATAIGSAAKEAKEFGAIAKPALEFAGIVAGGLAAAAVLEKVIGWIGKLRAAAMGPIGIAITVGGAAKAGFDMWAESEAGLANALRSAQAELALRRRSLQELQQSADASAAAIQRNLNEEARLVAKVTAAETALAAVRANSSQTGAQRASDAFRRGEAELINEQAAAEAGRKKAVDDTTKAWAEATKGVKTAATIEREYRAEIDKSRIAFGERIQALSAAGAATTQLQEAAQQQVAFERAALVERNKSLESLGADARRIVAADYAQRLEVIKAAADAEQAAMRQAVAAGITSEREGMVEQMQSKLRAFAAEYDLIGQALARLKPKSAEWTAEQTKQIKLLGDWREAVIDGVAAIDKLDAKSLREFNAEYAKSVEQSEKRVGKLEDEAVAEQRRSELIGKTAQEVDNLKAAWLEEQAVRADAQAAGAMYALEDEAEIDRLKRAAQALRDKAAASRQAGVNEGLKADAQAIDKLIDDVADKAGNFLEDFAHNGSKAFKNLWNDFVSWGLKALAQIAARQIVLSIGGAVGGTAGNAIASGLGGSSGLGSIGSMAGSAGQSALTSYLSAEMLAGSATSTAVAGGIASTFGPSAYTAALAGDAFMPAALGAAGAGEAAIGSLAGAMGMVPVIGWVALAAAIVYGIVQGMEEGPAERLADFVSGAAAKGGNPKFSSSSKFGDFGFVNDKWFSDDPGFVNAINSITTAVKGLDNSIAGLVGDDMAQTIADALATHTQSVSMGSEDANLNQVAAISGAQILMDRYTVVLGTIDASLDDLLQGFSGTGAELAVFVNDIVGVYEALKGANVAELFGGELTVAAFDALRGESETLGAAFQRLAGEFALTNAAAALIGGSFGEVGLASATAREQLIKFAGGADALAANLATFDQAFYTDAERLARTETALTEAMDALNLTLPTTRDGFRDLVEGLDLATESGRQTYASLLGLAAAADQIYDAVEAAKANARTGDARGSDQINYAELAASSATASGVISNALRDSQDALAAWDARDLGSYAGGWAPLEMPQDQIAAATTVVDWSSQIARKQIELLRASGKEMEALNAERALELASLVDAPEELRTLVEQLYDLRAAAITAADAAEVAAEAQRALIKSTTADIAIYQTTIDAFLAPLGDLDAAMREISPPALTLVDLWAKNKSEMQALADALAEIDGSKATTAIERLSQTMQQIDAIAGARSGIASSIVDLKASKGDASAVAFLKAQEASLTAQLATATDKGPVAQALTAAVMKRIQIEGQLEQRAINAKWATEQDALKDQIALAREARQTQISALEEQINGAKRLREVASGIGEYLSSLRAGNLSPLGYTERLSESQGIFEKTLKDALGGNADALGNLRGSAQDYLQQAQQYFGGATTPYAGVFGDVTSALEQFGIDGLARGQTDALQAQLEALRAIEDATEQTAAVQVDTTDRQIAAYEALDVTFARVEDGLKSSAQEQTAAIKEQITELKVVVANQEAQIRQAADAYAKMLDKLADMTKKLDDLKADNGLTTAAA